MRAVLYTLSTLFTLAGLAAGVPAQAQVGVGVLAAESTEPLRAFDAQDYGLAYDVLLGAGDLRRAFQVAQKAVQSVPRDRAWRRKLAQVSRWIGRIEVAAEQWLALFGQGDRAADTLENVMALAPLFNQPQMALQAWQVYAHRHDLTPAQWQDIFALFESTAQPVLGADFFEAQFKQRGQALLLDYAARLAENAGEDARAEGLYRQRSEMLPFDLGSVLRAVVFQIRRNHLAQALELLQRHAPEVPADAAAFWQLLGQVAWEAGDQRAALQAYQRYATLPAAGNADWVRLVELLRQQHPQQAADLALQAYRRFGAIDQLLTALSLYAQLGDQAAQARVLSELGAEATNVAGREPRFLLWRAQFYQRQRQIDLAWADLQVLLRRLPGDVDVLLSSLWLLIDSQRLTELPTLLHAHAAQAAGEPRLWSAYAAASQVLNRQRDALRWYARMVRADQGDPLTLLNYADALERAAQVGMADRVRQHAWQQLKRRGEDGTALLRPGASPELLALARLSLLNQPGDPAQQLIERLVRQLRALPAAQQDEQLIQLVLGWAIVKEQFGNAQAWLWRNYARQTQRDAPLWGVAQTALQLGDAQTMAHWLARKPDALPIYNRYDMAFTLGHQPWAQSVAFDGMSMQDDEPLYDRYRQHVPEQASYLQWEGLVDHGSQLNAHGHAVELQLALTPQWRLDLSGQRLGLGADAAALTLVTPASDRLTRAALTWQGIGQSGSVTLSKHGALASVTGLRLRYNLAWGQRWALEGGMAYHTESALSEPMRVAGQEDSVFAGVTYNLGRREYGRLGLRRDTFATQWGDPLGKGLALELEAGYRIRTEYPDWRVRSYLTRQMLTRATPLSSVAQQRLSDGLSAQLAQEQTNAVAFFVPESATLVGVCGGMGENLAGQSLQTYSRGWRPYGELCLNHNASSGTSASATLGLVGSITGEDHLRVQLENSDASGVSGTSATRLTVRYRHYF